MTWWETWKVLQMAGEACVRSSAWPWWVGGQEWVCRDVAEQTGAGTHAGACEGSQVVGAPVWAGGGGRGRRKEPSQGRVHLVW